MSSKREKVETNQAPAAIGPYSQAIKIEHLGLVILSGQIGLKPDGSGPEGDISVQTNQVMKNIAAVLEAAGSSLQQIVRTTVFMTDLKEFNAMNEVYQQFMQEPYPARAAVEVCALPRGAVVEIDAIATTVVE